MTPDPGYSSLSRHVVPKRAVQIRLLQRLGTTWTLCTHLTSSVTRSACRLVELNDHAKLADRYAVPDTNEG